jgi:hypothetical protein
MLCGITSLYRKGAPEGLLVRDGEPNPLMDDVACSNQSTGLGALLDDLDVE